MRKDDFDTFSALLDATCSLLSRGNYQPNAMNAALFFRALARFDLRTVQAAFDAHIADPQRGRFAPTPADIVAQIEGAACADGRPDTEEAWAIAFRSRDEAATVVWTDETAAALGEVKPLLDAGDDVAARMAFKAVYGRLVAEAREQRRPVRWTPSYGTDADARNVALLPHVTAGRLPGDVLQLEAPQATKLLEAVESAPIDVKAKLATLRDVLAGKRTPTKSLAELDRERTAALKTLAAQRVTQFSEGAGRGE